MKFARIEGNLYKFTDSEWKRYLAFQMAGKTYRLSANQNLGACPNITTFSKDDLVGFIKETLGPSGLRQVQNLSSFLNHLPN